VLGSLAGIAEIARMTFGGGKGDGPPPPSPRRPTGPAFSTGPTTRSVP
jgi:hypothetical protein